MFFLSKIFWAVFSPTSLLVWLSIAGLVLFFINRHSMALAMFGLLAATILVLSASPLGPWMLRGLEAQHDRPQPMPATVSGIILLGGAEQTRIAAERGAPSLSGAGERYLAFAELARRYPEAPLYFSGGIGRLDRSVPPETTVLLDVAERLGIDRARLILDGDARNTRENAEAIRRLIEQNDTAPAGEGPLLLITSAFHMPRAMRHFDASGLAVTAYPCDWRSQISLEWFPGLGRGMDQFSTALRERIGLLAITLF